MDTTALFICCCCCCVTSVVSNSVWPHRRQPTRLPVPGILQARTLEWVAISFSSAWKWKVKSLSRSVVSDSSDPMDCSLPGSSTHGIFQAKVLEWVLTSWWTFGLFPLFDFYKYCGYEHLCTALCVNICFQFSWVYTPGSGIAGS